MLLFNFLGKPQLYFLFLFSINEYITRLLDNWLRSLLVLHTVCVMVKQRPPQQKANQLEQDPLRHLEHKAEHNTEFLTAAETTYCLPDAVMVMNKLKNNRKVIENAVGKLRKAFKKMHGVFPSTKLRGHKQVHYVSKNTIKRLLPFFTCEERKAQLAKAWGLELSGQSPAELDDFSHNTNRVDKPMDEVEQVQEGAMCLSSTKCKISKRKLETMEHPERDVSLTERQELLSHLTQERELDLRERELRLREREVRLKREEIQLENDTKQMNFTLYQKSIELLSSRDMLSVEELAQFKEKVREITGISQPNPCVVNDQADRGAVDPPINALYGVPVVVPDLGPPQVTVVSDIS